MRGRNLLCGCGGFFFVVCIMLVCMKKFLFLGFVFVGIYFFARVLFVWDRANSDVETRVSVEVQPGASSQAISLLLEDRGVIRDSFVFRVFLWWYDLGTKLQAGAYVIPKNLTFSEVVEILQHGKSAEMKITIPEGSTIAQIDDILVRKMLIEPGDFVHCANFCDLNIPVSSLEGYLFPSTYFVNPKNFVIKDFVHRLYREFENQIRPLQKQISESGRTLREIVIVASMIEREAFADAEMSKVSDVIWKRLDSRMYLGIDATTRYAKNDWKSGLTSEDFEVDSPYNTRKNLGLPPTAISNPGVAALRAAVFPEQTSYWYYLHDKNGEVHFGVSLEEHNSYKRRYLY